MRSGGPERTTRRCEEIPTPAPYLREALTFAEFEPGIYDVVESYEGSRDTVPSSRLGSTPGT